jgi:ankyrin repeat protein
MRAKFILEKFQKYSDPIHDLGIGIKELIKRFIKEKGYNYIEDHLLWICAQEGKVEFVKYLLDAGANVHAYSDDALRLASDNGHTEVVKLLLDAGADVHAYDDYALRLASENGHTEVVKLLLDAGANVHADKDYALRWASEYGHTEIVKLLLDVVADVHAHDNYALRWASDNGHTEVVKLLLDAGADVHVDDDYALRLASEKGHIEVVKLLLDAGADVHAKDDLALRWASEYGHTEIVKLLLDAVADVHAHDNYALRWASDNGHTEVVKLLKDYIAKEKGRVVKESLNEKFEKESDPIKDIGIGYSKRMLNSMSMKILQFLENKGEEGASLKEIQYFIWIENGNDPKKFFEKSDYYGRTISQRKTRGYWNTNLLGSSYSHEGLLHKFCKQNPETKKWILKRYPEFKEKFYDWRHR